MSFPTYPNEAAGSGPPPPGGCACYPAGNTPDYQYFCLSGVRAGALWSPPDPPPPNGTYKMSKSDTCTWFAIVDGVTYVYQSRNGFAALGAIIGAVTVFVGIDLTLCTYFFANLNSVPAGNHYYGGHGLVVSLMSDMTYSERDLQESVGFDPAAESYARPFPFAGPQAVHRFSRKIDNSNIHILVDHS